jgi:hypothetical protein
VKLPFDDHPDTHVLLNDDNTVTMRLTRAPSEASSLRKVKVATDIEIKTETNFFKGNQTISNLNPSLCRSL